MKIGIVGTGKIACEALGVIDNMPSVEAVSIFARSHSRAKGEELARRHGIAEVYTDYAQMLRRTNADFIYIGLVNSAHFATAAQALQAGHNVIVEKPMSPTAAEVEQLAAMARERGLLLVEAVTLLHMPSIAAIAEALPRIGKVHVVSCSYCQYSSRYDRYLRGDVAPAFDPALNGGALLDLNVYNLNFVVALFGTPQAHTYMPVRGHNGIDTSGTMLLRYPELVASCTAAKDCCGDNFAFIGGERGHIKVTGPVSELRKVEICVDGHCGLLCKPLEQHRMEAEFEAFGRMLAAHDTAAAEHFLKISAEVARLTEAAGASTTVHSSMLPGKNPRVQA